MRMNKEAASKTDLLKEPITYDLGLRGQPSLTYYPDVAKFTDLVLARAAPSLIPIAAEYRNFLSTYGLEELRSVEEYTFELLNFGTLWRTYGARALAVKFAPLRTLATLSEWRKKHQRIKPAIDVLRGVLMTVFLMPPPKQLPEGFLPSLPQVERLIAWLEATGDLREDAVRFIRWQAFWLVLAPEQAQNIVKAAIGFSKWFEEVSRSALGTYTPNVDSFSALHSDRYYWREDRISCLRSRLEYHVNMVGAEILNRAFRGVFHQTKGRAVLVPGCMRARPEGECEAERTVDGPRCTGCTPACHTNQLRALGGKHGFEVFILPHASDLSHWSAKPGDEPRGVVGVACLSTLVGGGWELKRYAVPAQCVLLDYCGCKKHWHEQGIETKLDIRELKRILEIG
ncbi:MAG TPA: hypothetical protein DEP53_12945 [Bacteroidetes bacterium]|nr:hypothetical protein [Bacteroidota bacterium]